MKSASSNTWNWLELDGRPGSAWPRLDKKRVLHVAINMPDYYSLPVRILSLLASQRDGIREKFDSRYIESTNNVPYEPLVANIVDWAPDIVAFSLNIWNRDVCIAIADRLRDLLPDVTILGGGQEVTHSVYDFLAIAPAFDYLIDGEGEIPFLQFLQQWQLSGRRLRVPGEVSGLHYRLGEESCFTRDAEVFSTLDEIPSPILAGLVPPVQKNFLGVMLEGSRGCPFRCSFCFEGAKKSKVRTASIERLVAEIEFMVAQGARYFHIMDAILCNSEIGRLKKLKEVFDRGRRQNQPLMVSVEAYADQITEEMAAYMDVFSIIDLGLQTTNPETAAAIRRPFSPEKYRQGLVPLRKTGSTFSIYLICGLPFETVVSFLRGIKFVLDEKPTRIFINELCLLNGTELRRKADEYGYHFEQKPPYMVFSSLWMSAFQLKFTQVAAKVVERYYNLSARAIYAGSPWLPKLVNREENSRTIALATGCSYNCPGCQSTHKVHQPLSLANLSSQLRDAADQDVDILIGDGVGDNTALLQLSGQLQLSGTARNRLIAPLNTFSNQEWVGKLVHRGFWHFKTFITALAESTEITNSDKFDAFSNLNRPYLLLGYASIRPFVEVVLTPGTATPEQYREQILVLVDQGVTVVTVPVAVELKGSEWQEMLLQTFNDAIEKRVWLKLPAGSAREAIKRIDSSNAAEILSCLRDFDLLSQEPETPPCYHHPLSTRTP